MRSLITALLVLCIPPLLSAQPATRLGVYDGMGFSVIEYNFYGREHDRNFESMAHLGLVVGIPLADNLLLSVRPALTTLNGTAGLAARVRDDGGTRSYRGMIKEQWVLETPVLAKMVFNGEEMRPYLAAGPYLIFNGNPAEIEVTGDVDPASPVTATYPTLSGGVMAAVGVEIRAASMLIIAPELAVRQGFAAPIDTPILTQSNTPRFLFSVGIIFPISHERWK